MSNIDISKYIDFTILKPRCREIELKDALDFAIEKNVASLCVAPSFVDYCANYLKINNLSLNLCSVVGFPLGYNTLETKMFECNDLIRLGVKEIDFVINSFYIENNNWTEINKEAKNIINICKNNSVICKWIVESSKLDLSKLIKLCKLANDLKPSYMKTSTGFEGVADLRSVEIMKKYLNDSIKIKASGGIKTKEDAILYISKGVNRIGTSSKII